ncbi:hypothetical protein [Candidatus Nitrospira bockiana]
MERSQAEGIIAMNCHACGDDLEGFPSYGGLCLDCAMEADGWCANAPGEATCRVCGCTELAACPGGCVWAEPDLCSRCVRIEEETDVA